MSYGRSHLGANADIAENISALAKKNNQLERMLAKMGTKADDRDFQDNLNETRSGGKDLCQQIINGLKDNRGADRTMQSKMSRQFQDELERFTQINKEIDRKAQAIVRRMSSSKGDSDGGNRPTGGLAQQQADDQIDIQFTVYDVEEIQARSAAIKNIERDVVELHEMFEDLKLLVDEQQESLDVIENNVTQAKDQVDSAQDELIAAEEYQKSSRKKQCCLIVIFLMIIAAIVIMVVVLKKD